MSAENSVILTKRVIITSSNPVTKEDFVKKVGEIAKNIIDFLKKKYLIFGFTDIKKEHYEANRECGIYKGFEEVLRAASSVWKRHSKTYFFFIGPKEGNAAAIFQKYNDKRLIEINGVDLYEKTSAIEACDILCMPSFYEAL